MKKIGFVGLGNMGSNMVRNLLKNGFDVNIYDVREEAMDSLEKLGATKCSSLTELANESEIIFVMVMSYDQVEKVTLGKSGIIASMSDGDVLVVCSTISPEQTCRIAAEADKKGVLYCDCPVSGGKDGAISGTLVMMAACSENTFERIKDYLYAMGSNTYHVSDIIGNGQIMKCVNQLMIATGMVIASEAVTMATKAGLKPSLIYDVIGKCTGCSDVFRDKIPLIIKRDFAVRGAADIYIKDLDIALGVGKEIKTPMFLSALVKQIFVWVNSCGYGQDDLGAVIRAYEDAAKVVIQD